MSCTKPASVRLSQGEVASVCRQETRDCAKGNAASIRSPNSRRRSDSILDSFRRKEKSRLVVPRSRLIGSWHAAVGAFPAGSPGCWDDADANGGKRVIALQVPACAPIIAAMVLGYLFWNDDRSGFRVWKEQSAWIVSHGKRRPLSALGDPIFQANPSLPIAQHYRSLHVAQALITRYSRRRAVA
jgi:hypothetical protein